MKGDRAFMHPTTRISADGLSVSCWVTVDRLDFEYARSWARFHAPADPNGTAEEQLVGFLSTALMHARAADQWEPPAQLKALYPKLEAPKRHPDDIDDDINF